MRSPARSARAGPAQRARDIAPGADALAVRRPAPRTRRSAVEQREDRGRDREPAITPGGARHEAGRARAPRAGIDRVGGEVARAPEVLASARRSSGS